MICKHVGMLAYHSLWLACRFILAEKLCKRQYFNKRHDLHAVGTRHFIGYGWLVGSHLTRHGRNLRNLGEKKTSTETSIECIKILQRIITNSHYMCRFAYKLELPILVVCIRPKKIHLPVFTWTTKASKCRSWVNIFGIIRFNNLFNISLGNIKHDPQEGEYLWLHIIRIRIIRCAIR